MPLNQGNLASSLANIIATYELTPEDRSLVVMPLFHVHGLMAGQPPLPPTPPCHFYPSCYALAYMHSHGFRLAPEYDHLLLLSQEVRIQYLRHLW